MIYAPNIQQTENHREYNSNSKAVMLNLILELKGNLWIYQFDYKDIINEMKIKHIETPNFKFFNNAIIKRLFCLYRLGYIK